MFESTAGNYIYAPELGFVIFAVLVIILLAVAVIWRMQKDID